MSGTVRLDVRVLLHGERGAVFWCYEADFRANAANHEGVVMHGPFQNDAAALSDADDHAKKLVGAVYVVG
jgi:hypothetical protein